MKTAFFSLLMLAAMNFTGPAAEARRSLDLDCNELGDGIEARICRSTKSKSCKSTAAKAVYLLESVRSPSKKVKIHDVHEIQEDATYEVAFAYAGQTAEIMFTRTVNVSTGPKYCELDSVE